MGKMRLTVLVPFFYLSYENPSKMFITRVGVMNIFKNVHNSELKIRRVNFRGGGVMSEL